MGGDSKIVQNIEEADIEIHIVDFDTFIKELGLNLKAGLIRIDVEGHEMFVLRGMKTAIQNMERGGIIIIECDNDPAEMIHFLEKFNFKLLTKYRNNHVFVKN